LPEKIEGATSRGMWVYDIADSKCELDNGMCYTTAQMIDFWRLETNKSNLRIVDLEIETEEYMNDVEKKKLEIV